MEDTTSIFFDKNFNPVNYLNSIFKKVNHKELNKLVTVSNNLIIHLNFLIKQLNDEILINLNKLNNAMNLDQSSRLDYYIKSLQNSIISLNNELNLPKFNQLLIINTLINFKLVKTRILEVLEIFKVLVKFSNDGEIKLVDFEKKLLAYHNELLELNEITEKLEKLDILVNLNDVFKNLNNFNTVYKRNVGKFIKDQENLM